MPSACGMCDASCWRLSIGAHTRVDSRSFSFSFSHTTNCSQYNPWARYSLCRVLCSACIYLCLILFAVAVAHVVRSCPLYSPPSPPHPRLSCCSIAHRHDLRADRWSALEHVPRASVPEARALSSASHRFHFHCASVRVRVYIVWCPYSYLYMYESVQ